jgi:hypothetical protein
MAYKPFKMKASGHGNSPMKKNYPSVFKKDPPGSKKVKVFGGRGTLDTSTQEGKDMLDEINSIKTKKSRPNQPDKGHDYSKRPYRYDKSKGSYVNNYGDKAMYTEKSIDSDYRGLRKYEKRMRKAKAVAKRAAKGAGKIAGKALMGGIIDLTSTTSPRLSDRKQFKSKVDSNKKKYY